MRQLIMTLLLVLSSFFLFGQNLHETIKFRSIADSIVIAFWGQNNFKRYIHFENLDNADTKTISENVDSSTAVSLIKPEYSKFKYSIIHPAFHGDTAKIEFELDSNGKLEVALLPQGLNRIDNLDSLILIDQNKALSIERKQPYWSSIKNIQKVSLVWHYKRTKITDRSIDSILIHYATKQYMPPIQFYTHGVLTWAIYSNLKKGFWQDGLYFSELVCYIDSTTGEVLGVEEY